LQLSIILMYNKIYYFVAYECRHVDSSDIAVILELFSKENIFLIFMFKFVSFCR